MTFLTFPDPFHLMASSELRMMDLNEEDDSSLSRSMFTFNGDSNTSLTNMMLLSDKIPSMQDYLDVSIDLNSVFDLNNSVASNTDEGSSAAQPRSLTTPTALETESTG